MHDEHFQKNNDSKNFSAHFPCWYKRFILFSARSFNSSLAISFHSKTVICDSASGVSMGGGFWDEIHANFRSPKIENQRLMKKQSKCIYYGWRLIFERWTQLSWLGLWFIKTITKIIWIPYGLGLKLNIYLFHHERDDEV